MSDLLQSYTTGFRALPPYGVGALLVLLLYAIESEVRFGARARTMATGASDRGSTIAVSLASLVPVFGFVLAMRGQTSALLAGLPGWLRDVGTMPGMPAIAWVGVVLGALGLLLRLWALLKLRHRYTRTLLVHEAHVVERGGPYRFVRHPGYLGSLLTLNGIALASGNALTFFASLVATCAAYAYRVRVEDSMLVAAFGAAYDSYRSEVGALLPLLR
jgi:protein-S-isoprenylcysteine O-methyltransferase